MGSKDRARDKDKTTGKTQRARPPIPASITSPREPSSTGTLVQQARLNPRSLRPGQVLQLQRTVGNAAVGRLLTGARKSPQHNDTALPHQLQMGFENLSGVPLDDVAVHHNSPKPAELQALAYTQGTDIYLGSGQEKHLPHEAWHVVQQKQGRVQATAQLRGNGVNQDAHLEREADRMSNRALQNTTSDGEWAKVKGPGQRAGSVATGSVVQCKYDITVDVKSLKTLEKLRKIAQVSSDAVAWWKKSDDVYKYIDDVRKSVEDDEDVKLLDALEQEIDGVFKDLDVLTRSINNYKLLFSEDRPRRRATLNPLKRKRGESVPGERSRTESDVLSGVSAKYQVFNRVIDRVLVLGKKFATLKRMFPLHKGGFSAKGRAHAMRERNKNKKGYQEVKTWFQGIKLDGSELVPNKQVYKPSNVLKIDESAADPAFPGLVRGQGPLKKKRKKSQVSTTTEVRYSLESFQQNATLRTTKLQELEKLFAALNLQQKQSYTGPPVSADRNGGQVVNMGNTNATGYAMLADVPNWENSRWEWLHVRAASLGGKTDGSNLVLGTRDVNTHMMPFEANLRLLANIVNENPNYKALEVDFSVSGQDNKAPHKVDYIRITWKLVKAGGADPTTKEATGEARFNPLNTSESISKTEVAILEEVLKAKRKGFKV